MFIRLFDKSPSLFRILDDPEGQTDFIDALALELESNRATDEGWVSYWLALDDTQKQHICAGLGARRKKRRLGVMSLPQQIVEGVEISIRIAPDPDIFKCIADCHRELLLEAEATCRTLATKICIALEQNELTPDDLYYNIKRREVGDFIAGVYQSCIEAENDLEIEKAEQWVQEHLKSLGQPEDTSHTTPDGA